MTLWRRPIYLSETCCRSNYKLVVFCNKLVLFFSEWTFYTLWHSKVHYRVHKRLPTDRVRSQMNPAPNLISHNLRIHFTLTAQITHLMYAFLSTRIHSSYSTTSSTILKRTTDLPMPLLTYSAGPARQHAVSIRVIHNFSTNYGF